MRKNEILNLPQSRFWGILSALLCFYWAMRCLTLFTAIEAVSWHEELAVGTIAREILLGLKTSIWQCQLDAYSGESLVAAPAAALSFYLFGSYLWALKITPIAFYFLTILISALFVKRHFDPSSALWTAFFLIFMPPITAAKTIIPVGGHSEALLITLLMLFAFYEFLFRAESKRRLLWLIIFSFLSGFNFWFYYIGGIAAAACVITWCIYSPKTFFSVRLLILGFFFGLGFSPWIYRWLADPLNGVEFLSITFPERNFWEQIFIIPKRIGGILLFSLPESFSFLGLDNFWRKPLAYTYYIVCCTSITMFIKKQCEYFRVSASVNPKIVFFLLYPVLFLFVYSLTEMDIPLEYSQGIIFRYYMPLYFIGFILLALAMKHLSKPLVLMLVALSLISQHLLFFKEPFKSRSHLLGYSYFERGMYWANNLRTENNLSKILVQLPASISTDGSANAFRGMLSEYWSGDPYWVFKDRKLNIPDMPAGISSAHKPIYLEEAASFLPVNYRDQDLRGLLDKTKALEEPLHQYFFKGVLTDFYGLAVNAFCNDGPFRQSIPNNYTHWGFFGAGKFFYANPLSAQDSVWLNQFVDRLTPQETAWYYRGIGSAIFHDYLSRLSVYTDLKNRIIAGVQSVPESSRPDFFWGVGWALHALWPDDHKRARSWSYLIPDQYQGEFQMGLANYQSWYSGNGLLNYPISESKQ